MAWRQGISSATTGLRGANPCLGNGLLREGQQGAMVGLAHSVVLARPLADAARRFHLCDARGTAQQQNQTLVLPALAQC